MFPPRKTSECPPVLALLETRFNFGPAAMHQALFPAEHVISKRLTPQLLQQFGKVFLSKFMQRSGAGLDIRCFVVAQFHPANLTRDCFW